MASKKDSVIFYQAQIKICKEFLTNEQFGRLMAALFELDDGLDPEVDVDIAMAFAFMSLQQRLDREKYEEKCRKNRENGKKGGRPPKPNKANGFFENPNDNDNDKRMKREENENVNVNESQNTSVFYGRFENVELTGKEYYTLKQEYERVTELINKVSLWLRTHEHPDHFALCITFAENDNWPKRKIIEPVSLPEVMDPLPDEEHDAKVAELKATIGGMFKA